MKTETIGPTFKKVILILATAAVGGGTVAAATTKDVPDPGPETNRRLFAVELRASKQEAQIEAIDKRTERMDSKLDRLIERK